MRRGGYTRIACREEGCPSAGSFEYKTRAEFRALPHLTYRCLKHLDQDEWLTPANARRSVTLVASRVPYEDRYLDGLFWIPEGKMSGSGFTFGPGFRASTKEFPEGTRLVVTVEALPPAVAEPKSPKGGA